MPDAPQLDGPRPARPGELDEAIDLADVVFRTSQGLGPTMEAEFPLLFAPDNVANLQVTRADGRVVSLAGLAIQRVASGGVELPVGCVGGVCTDPAWRGRGLGRAGLDAAASAALSAGCPLLMISGVGGLYEQAGATPIAPVRQYLVDRYKLGDPDIPDAGDVTFRLAARTDTEPLVDLHHRADDPRYAWSPDVLGRLIDATTRVGLRVWVAQRGDELLGAMMLRSAPHVGKLYVSVLTQFVGPADAFVPLAARAMDGLAPKTLLVRQLPGERRLERVLRRYDHPHLVRPECSVLVLDLPGLLRAFAPRLAGSGVALSADGEALRIEAAGERVELVGPRAVNAALFNGASRWPDALRALARPARSALAKILPLPLPDYGLNYV